MLNIKKHLISTLKPLNIPCYFATNFNSTDNIYFVFFIDREEVDSVVDDEEAVIKYSITLYLNSNVEYDDIAFEAQNLLKTNKYKIVYTAEDYDNQTKYYTKAFKIEFLDFLI